MGIDFTNNKIYVHRLKFKPLYIGLIEKDTKTLYIHDRDNYLPLLNGLGVDEEVLTSRNLHYHYLKFKFKGEKYCTTRKYFFDHAKAANMFNGRTMLFLPIPYFGLDLALNYEQTLKDEKLSEMSLFDIVEKMHDTNSPRLLNLWMDSVEKAEKANRLIKKKGIIL